jgi:hypothetical protein
MEPMGFPLLGHTIVDDGCQQAGIACWRMGGSAGAPELLAELERAAAEDVAEPAMVAWADAAAERYQDLAYARWSPLGLARDAVRGVNAPGTAPEALASQLPVVASRAVCGRYRPGACTLTGSGRHRSRR